MHLSRFHRHSCFGLVALLVISSRAQGQVVRGTIRDEASRAAIAAAHVVVLNDELKSVARALTDSAGVFAVRVPGPGEYSYRVERIGYATTSTRAWPVGHGEEQEIEIVMAPKAVPMLPLTIVASRTIPSAALAGFSQRITHQKRLGQGRMLERADIEKHGPQSLINVLVMTPGIRPFFGNDGTMALVTRGGALKLELGEPPPPPCLATVYLDGARLSAVGDAMAPFRRLAQLNASDVEGIEVYVSASEVPAEFISTTGSCGVIAVWTRRT